MVLLNTVVTRCYETETPLCWVTQGRSEQLRAAPVFLRHSPLPFALAAAWLSRPVTLGLCHHGNCMTYIEKYRAQGRHQPVTGFCAAGLPALAASVLLLLSTAVAGIRHILKVF